MAALCLLGEVWRPTDPDLVSSDPTAWVHVVWNWLPDYGLRLAWRIDTATLILAGLVAGIGSLVMHFAGAYFGPSRKGIRSLEFFS